MGLFLIAFAASVVSGVAQPFTSNLAQDPENTFKLDWSLTNTGSLPLTFFIWGTPFENSDVFRSDLFDIVAGRVSAIYIGASAKRVITESAFHTLQPNETVHSTLNLLDGYYFPGKGDYKLSYKSDTIIKIFVGSNLPRLTSVGNFRNYNFAPQHLVISVTTNQPVPALLIPPLFTPESGGILEFINCSQAKQDVVNDAYPNILTLLSGVQTYLAADTCDTRLVYQAYFGACDDTRFAKIKSDFDAIIDRANQGFRVQCGGSTCSPTTYAFVTPNDAKFVVHLCDLTFADTTPRENCKDSSVQGTMIHELTHFKAVAGTLDVIYGSAQCIMEGQFDPDSAILNADSHEYLAESCPGRDLAPTTIVFNEPTDTTINLPYGQSLPVEVQVTGDGGTNPTEGLVYLFAQGPGVPFTNIGDGKIQNLGTTIDFSYNGRTEAQTYQISALFHNFFGTEPWLFSITPNIDVTSDLTPVTFSNPVFTPPTAYYNQDRSITVDVSPTTLPPDSTFKFFYGPATKRTAFNSADTILSFDSNSQASASLGYGSIFSHEDTSSPMPVWVQFTGAPSTPGMYSISDFYSMGTIQVDPLPTYCFFAYADYPDLTLEVEINTDVTFGGECAPDVDSTTYPEEFYELPSGGIITYVDQDNNELGQGSWTITTQFALIQDYTITMSQFKSTETYYLDSGVGTNTLTITVTKASTTTAFNSPPTSVHYGNPILFDIDVTSQAGDVNTGIIKLSLGATRIGDPDGYPVTSNRATVSLPTQNALPFTPLGYQINAFYYSDESDIFKDSDTTSKPAQVSVLKATTTTAFASTPPSGALVYGQPISINLTVTSQLEELGIVSEGRAGIKKGTTILGTTQAVKNGVATVIVNTAEIGSNQLTGYFDGSGTTFGASSTVNFYQVTVTSKAQTNTSFALSKITNTYGTPLDIQVNIKAKAPSTAIVKEGQVTIKEGARSLGSTLMIVNGGTTITILSLDPGVHTLTANFLASTHFAGSSTNTSLILTVANVVPTFETYTANLQKGTIKTITITNTFKIGTNAITPTKITTISYKAIAFYNFAPQSASAVNPSSLRVKARTTVTLSLSAFSTKPIFIYCANWPKGKYTFTIKLTLRTKQGVGWSFGGTPSVLTITSGVFNGILEIPVSTKNIGWGGVPTVKTSTLEFTLGA